MERLEVILIQLYSKLWQQYGFNSVSTRDDFLAKLDKATKDLQSQTL